ncbi:Ubiquinone/menaquinone biosynthesis C-methylase UbiE [Hymenobacter daecheongensis DSM 21074]|uniref:Ubiquinone/menaquinone biosynthesis C-methylase UbiE n=1 Tax=Hymenobacter daecheongensis DSM 21074 TaxID=1121955 RepID=A0A1M6C8P9_9BACT|nr:class I SAM-dependent methyltransferase [Hymenobacter daecheongensis]SHI57412.1 Ubiquinone/menaquinone biosynthesis C-methylase UbiE [Hymenobacter daecheongensis DSM 21074]
MILARSVASRLLVPGILLFHTACTQPPAESTAATLAEQRRRMPPDTTGYESRPPADPNGISRYYLGRQIAHVMGHEGADWLERSGRQQEEGTDILLRELKLKPTDVVADLGAGTGYFTFRISPLVPKGRVLAVDIQPEMIAALKASKDRAKITNVEPVLGTVQNPNLPAKSVDLVLIVDAYHEFDHPREMMRAVRASLTPTGRVALVEYRAEDPKVPIKRIHKMSVEQARKEMAAVGLEFVESVESLPQQHLLFFKRAK